MIRRRNNNTIKHELKAYGFFDRDAYIHTYIHIYIPWICKCVTKTAGDGTTHISYAMLVNNELHHVSSDSCFES